MKNLLLSVLTVLSSLSAWSVPASQTDLPNAYGEQLKNSTFDGNWESTNNEPSDASWHSFNTADTNFITKSAQTNAQSGYSLDIRPGANAGSKSAMIKARNIAGLALANGNITTGKIQCGTNISAKDLKNKYNRTVRSDAKYRTSFMSKPDSMTVWVKFTTNSDQNFARLSVIVHDDVRDTQDAPSNVADRNSICGVLQKEFNRQGGNWQRLSVPFSYYPQTYYSYLDFSKSEGLQEYALSNVEPKYILATFTTNKIASEGDQNDVLLIDDILMIYNPTLSIGTLSGSSYAKGGSITVPYTLEGTMSPYNSLAAKNKVILQLSDANGSFENPTVLNEVETDFGGEISGTIPNTVANGTGYRVRIVTTNYPMTSSDNGFDISISTPTNIQPISTPSVTLSPNPAQGVVEISNFDILQAEIFNLQGQSVSAVLIVGNNRIDVSTLPVGSYILQLKGRDGQMVRTKLLINR